VPWDSIDFKTAPAPYLTAVLRYAFEGNLEHDWVVKNNKVRDWYHAPGLQGPELAQDGEGICKNEKGREFVHGLTRERYSSLAELNYRASSGPAKFKDTKPVIQNWAVAMYNAPGGWVLGQVWNEMTVHQRDPHGRLPSPENITTKFPLGTVAVKLLFTEATPSQVPYLQDSPEWEANINRGKQYQGIAKLRLLQVDVAVRDRRAEADGSGWVFGTFEYRYHADPVKSALFDYPAMMVNGQDITLPWRQLEPIGLMWGNGLEAKDGSGSPQTVLANEEMRASQHLGCQGRLSGPVDNPSASCISCHAMAELRNSDPVGGQPGKPFEVIKHEGRFANDQCRFTDDLPFWFRKVPFRQTFSDHALSLDLSLQLQNGIVRFCQFNPDDCPKIEGRIAFDPQTMKLSDLRVCENQAPCSDGRQILRARLRRGAGNKAPCTNTGGGGSRGGGGEVTR
jgi:hypothetical protein